MPKKEYSGITRLKDPARGLRAIFDKIFNRTTTAKQVHTVMNLSVAAIIREAQALQAGMGHLDEIYSDSQEISNELAHITTYVINLPVTVQSDVGYWEWAIDWVEVETFEEGAESVNLDKLEKIQAALGRVIAHKREHRDKARDMGTLH